MFGNQNSSNKSKKKNGFGFFENNDFFGGSGSGFSQFSSNFSSSSGGSGTSIRKSTIIKNGEKVERTETTTINSNGEKVTKVTEEITDNNGNVRRETKTIGGYGPSNPLLETNSSSIQYDARYKSGTRSKHSNK